MDDTHVLCTHLLELSYPDTDLLPSDARPYLEVPKDVGSRERPMLGTFHLSTNNLAFFVQLPTTPADFPPELFDEDVDDITQCEYWLSKAPGLSKLSAVSFLTDDDIVTRFSLKTTWFIRQWTTAEVEKQFELPWAAWQLALSYKDLDSKRSWTALMNDLILGCSDRAVLHRRQRMYEYDRDFALQDESSWITDWEGRPDAWSNQLLANHLERMAYEDDDEDTFYAPVVTLAMYDDIKDISVRLPCNHESRISIGTLKALSTEDCLAARCEVDTCRRRIMDKRDEGLLELAAHKEQRAQWTFEQIDWERYDHEIADRPNTASVTGHDLYLSIKFALGSMRAPVSATPAALDLTTLLETKIVKKHLKQMLSGASHIDWTARKVLIQLQQEASKALKCVSPFDLKLLRLILPPGFEDFLVKWLTRAVNHAIPQISTQDMEADFANVLNSLQSVKLDGSAQEEVGNTDEITEMVTEMEI